MGISAEHYNVHVNVKKVQPRSSRMEGNDRVIEELLSMTVKASTPEGAIQKAISLLQTQGDLEGDNS